jgi:hypothetical protein
MNTRIIEPKSIWSPNGERIATILSLLDFRDYNFDNGGGKLTYKLLGMESIDSQPETAVDYYVADMYIPSEISQQWGASDEIIFEYVATSLGLILIP